MPNEAKAKNIHGEVEVFVQLKSNGEVSQVKVAKPLCTECDAEAIRLVKEGPKFELKNNKTKKVKVKVKF
ncbi:MAG: TonB family protein [Chitinophagaceae bacterium]|nr:TonB family protein [Chitinophagaceae bacterium]